MIYGYARVSTKKQLHGNSIEEQHNTLIEQGCQEIVTEQYTGKTTDRPELKLLMGKMKKRRYSGSNQTGSPCKKCSRRNNSNP